MEEQQYMIAFTVLGLYGLGIGAVALSLVTLLGRGSRVWAIVVALVEIGMGGVMWATLDVAGAGPTVIGVVSLVIAVLPRRGVRRE